MKRTIAIVSGGLDSTVLAHHIKNSSSSLLVGLVTVDYGQRHRREIDCARQTAVDLDVPHHLLDLSSIRPHIGSSVLTGDEPVPHGHYAAENMKVTVVPNRNMILMALAVGVAISERAECVVYGAHAGDRDVYPDCRREFVEAMKAAVALCDYNPPEIFAPFVGWSKAEVVQRGLELDVDFRNTWTCYEGGQLACGRCGTCVERLEAFSMCSTEDPIDYTDRTYWKEVTR